MNLDVIRTLTIKSRTEGVAESTAALKGLNDEYEGLAKSAGAAAIVTDTTAKRQLSLADTLNKLERQFNTAIRAQQDFEKVQRQLNAAVAQNPALQDRANAVLALAKERYDHLTTATATATAGQTAMQAATSGISGQLVAMAAGAGPVGVFLAALGPWGLAAAVALGLVASAIRHVIEESERMGKAAVEARLFADVTGLTIIQIKALQDVAGKFGVEANTVGQALQNFTTGARQARVGTGDLFDAIRALSPSLAQLMLNTRTMPEAWDVFTRAVALATDEMRRNELVAAALGRRNLSVGLVAVKSAEAGGIDKLAENFAKASGQTEDWNKQLADAQSKLDAVNKRVKELEASQYALQVIQAQISKAEQYEGIIRYLERIVREWGNVKTAVSEAAMVEQAEQARIAAAERVGGRRGRAAGATQIDPEAAAAAAAAAQGRALLIQARKELDEQIAKADKGAKVAADGYEEFNKIADKFRGGIAEQAKELDKVADAQANEKIARQDAINTAQKQLNQEKERVALKGSSATIEDQRILREKELTLAYTKNQFSLEGVTKNEKLYQEAIKNNNAGAHLQQQQAITTAYGTGATAAERYALQVDQIRASMQNAGASSDQIERAVAALSNDEAIRSQRAMISALGDLASPMDIYKLKVMQLQQQLTNTTISQEQFNKGILAAHPLFQNLTKFGEQFTNNFVQGMLQGKSATESLHAAMKSLASSLASGAIAALFRGDLFTAAIMGIGALIASMFGGSKDKDDKLNRAKETWEAMRKDIERFVDKLSGNTGSVKAAWQDIQDEIDKFQAAAGAAEDSAGRDKIGNDLHKFQVKLAEEFAYTLTAILKSWNDGFGADSAFIKGMEHVKSVAEEVAKVLADIKFLYGGAGGENLGGDDYTAKMTEATNAATKYLLSLISGTDELSDITNKLQDMRGAAYQLQIELVKLGYTSEQAAALIADTLTKAIAKLIETFYDDLERKINDQGGKDYLNKVKDLIDEIVQLFADALALGLDATKTILDYYTTEILKIVDSSTEVTQAKQDLIDAYNKEKDAIESSIDAINSEIEALMALKTTIASMIDDIALSGMTALERLVTMQHRFRSWMAYVMDDPSKVKSEDLTKAVESAKAYLDAIKEMQAIYEQLIQTFNSLKETIQAIIDAVADSKLSSEEKLTQGFDKFLDAWQKMLVETVTKGGGGNVDAKFYEDIAKYGQQLLDAIDAVISGLEQRIAKLQGARDAMLAYVDQLELGMLTPQELLTEMRRRYQETLAKAMGGDEDALAKLTEDARNYIDALKAQSDALQQTSDKLAGLIETLKAFRESLKTDSNLSILSPEDQLAAAKANFDRLTALAQGGDLEAAAQLSDAARRYLDLARGYFASSEAYAEIYRQVDAILKQTEESLGEQKSIADQQLAVLKEELGAIQDVIDELKAAADVAQQQIDLLQKQIDELKKLKETVAKILETVVDMIDTQISLAQAQLDALEKLKDEVLEALSQMVDVINTVITWQTIQTQILQWQLDTLTSYVSQYVDINNSVKTVTQAVTDLKITTYQVLTDIFNELSKNSGAQSGGLIGMAGGGMVSGGIWNQDSVRARFAGGGNIMLAGGEYVTTAPSVNANTIGTLDHINRTGTVANDNGQHFTQLARTIARVASATTTAEIESNREEMRMLRAEVRNLGNRNATRERGTKVASG